MSTQYHPDKPADRSLLEDSLQSSNKSVSDANNSEVDSLSASLQDSDSSNPSPDKEHKSNESVDISLSDQEHESHGSLESNGVLDSAVSDSSMETETQQDITLQDKTQEPALSEVSPKDQSLQGEINQPQYLHKLPEPAQNTQALTTNSNSDQYVATVAPYFVNNQQGDISNQAYDHNQPLASQNPQLAAPFSPQLCPNQEPWYQGMPNQQNVLPWPYALTPEQQQLVEQQQVGAQPFMPAPQPMPAPQQLYQGQMPPEIMTQQGFDQNQYAPQQHFVGQFGAASNLYQPELYNQQGNAQAPASVSNLNQSTNSSGSYASVQQQGIIQNNQGTNFNQQPFNQLPPNQPSYAQPFDPNQPLAPQNPQWTAPFNPQLGPNQAPWYQGMPNQQNVPPWPYALTPEQQQQMGAQPFMPAPQQLMPAPRPFVLDPHQSYQCYPMPPEMLQQGSFPNLNGQALQFIGYFVIVPVDKANTNHDRKSTNSFNNANQATGAGAVNHGASAVNNNKASSSFQLPTRVVKQIPHVKSKLNDSNDIGCLIIAFMVFSLLISFVLYILG